jgi:hypothetical protein
MTRIAAVTTLLFIVTLAALRLVTQEIIPDKRQLHSERL